MAVVIAQENSRIRTLRLQDHTKAGSTIMARCTTVSAQRIGVSRLFYNRRTNVLQVTHNLHSSYLYCYKVPEGCMDSVP